MAKGSNQMCQKELALLTDLYEITMMQGYFSSGMAEKTVVFDLFHRQNPSGNGFSIAAGLEQVIEYIKNLKFTKKDIKYLKSLEMFTPDFLEHLKTFRFTGSIHAVPEGTIIFPGEPIVRVTGAHHGSAAHRNSAPYAHQPPEPYRDKAARVVLAAKGDPVMEFGLRPGAGAGRRGLRSPRGCYRRLHRHQQRACGAGLRHTREGYPRTQLGHELPLGVRGFPGHTPGYSPAHAYSLWIPTTP